MRPYFLGFFVQNSHIKQVKILNIKIYELITVLKEEKTGPGTNEVTDTSVFHMNQQEKCVFFGAGSWELGAWFM